MSQSVPAQLHGRPEALEVGLELLGRLAPVLELGLHAHAGEGELLGDLLPARAELLGDEGIGERDVDLALS